MSDSAFDVETFTSQVVEDANEERRTPLPEGDFEGFIEKHEVRPVDTKAGQRLILDVQWHITDQRVADATGLDKPMCRQSVWLDVENGALAFGHNKNVGLGKLRAAVGQNEPGKPWQFAMLDGAGPALCSIKHRTDPRDPEIIYDEVSKIVAVQ